MKNVIELATVEIGIDQGAFWQCFPGEDSALSRWKNGGGRHFTKRLIGMFEGSRSRSGYRVTDASVAWETLSPLLRKGEHLVLQLKTYAESVERQEVANRRERLRARVDQQELDGSTVAGAEQPAFNRVRIKDQERLFGILPLYGQSDERSADLIVDMSFWTPDREIFDADEDHAVSDTINVAINRCGVHVDWPNGEIRGENQIWKNTDEVEHRLQMLGVRKARTWLMESCVPGTPLRGVFEGQYLCRLEGADRSTVRVRLSFTVSDLNITSNRDSELVGIDRLRVFKRFLAQRVENEFDQNSLLTVYEGPVQKLGDV